MHVAGSCGAPGGTPSPEGGKRDLISGGRALGLVEEGRERLRGLEAARSIPGWGSGVPGLALHGAAFGYFGGLGRLLQGRPRLGRPAGGFMRTEANPRQPRTRGWGSAFWPKWGARGTPAGSLGEVVVEPRWKWGALVGGERGRGADGASSRVCLGGKVGLAAGAPWTSKGERASLG